MSQEITHKMELQIAELKDENRKIRQILKDMKELPIVEELVRLKRKLKIAKEALKLYADDNTVYSAGLMINKEYNQLGQQLALDVLEKIK